MAERRTRVVLSVPWDDEINDHPLGWDWDTLISSGVDQHGVGVLLVTTEEITPKGEIEPE